MSYLSTMIVEGQLHLPHDCSGVKLKSKVTSNLWKPSELLAYRGADSVNLSLTFKRFSKGGPIDSWPVVGLSFHDFEGQRMGSFDIACPTKAGSYNKEYWAIYRTGHDTLGTRVTVPFTMVCCLNVVLESS